MMQQEIASASIGPQPVRLRLSVDEYHSMYERGLIPDFEKLEIIDGELIRKMSIGERHARIVNLLMRFLNRNLPENVLVSGQNPLRVTDFDEPEPDIVLADLTKYDGRRHPTPADAILVIEVSDTSLRFDRNTKLPLYAAAEVPEVWIINLPANLVEIHQHPDAGIYQQTRLFRPGDSIVSESLPALSLSVNELLD